MKPLRYDLTAFDLSTLGILQGPPDLKELAATGLGEVIKLTSPEALKPSVVNITGPLIRILGDRLVYVSLRFLS